MKQKILANQLKILGEEQVLIRKATSEFLPPAQRIDWVYLSELLDNTPINTIKSWLRIHTHTKRIQGVPLSKVEWIERKIKGAENE
jgi:hypothetical protein